MNFLRLPALLALAPAALFAQTDDFNDGNDTGWTRFNPIGVAAYSFVNGGYRISASPSPDPGTTGPGRGGALRQDVIYDRFHVSVDIVDWDATQDASLGIVARIQPNPAPGALGCYALTLNVQDNDMGIELVQNEVPTNLGGYAKMTLVPGHKYRMVFSGAGDALEAALYDLEDLSLPIGTRSVQDATFARGTCGLVVFSDENTQAAGTFDNYRAAEGDATPDDDFNDGNDAGWIRSTPAGTGSFQLIDGHYRINASPTSNPTVIGPARTGALRPEVLSDFCIECDVAAGNAAGDSSFGLLARVNSPGLGTLDGYVLTWQNQGQDIQINSITNEAPTRISPIIPAFYDPAKRYRMVFCGRGDRLEGRVYDLATPAIPLAVTTAVDGAYASGQTGLLVFSSDNGAASFDFDTWRANNGAPPPLNITFGSGEVRVWWDHYRALGHDLQFSPDLSAWQIAMPGSVFLHGGHRAIFPLTVQPGGSDFARLSLLPP